VKLLLVRHGESTWNAEGRYQGRLDAPLSERGVAQAEALAKYLAATSGLRPAAIVSSPLSRALRTAAIVGDSVGREPRTDARLIEICHGEWEGLLREEVRRRWPEVFKAWRERPETVRFEGGESLADVRERWRSFFADAVTMPSPLLVTTHDVIVRLAVLDIRGQDLSQFRTLRSANAAITEIDITNGDPKVARLNDGTYLAGLQADATRQAL